MTKKVFGTKEWASSNVNFMFGCQHDCKYCYAKSMAPRHGSITIQAWSKPIIRHDKIDKGYGKRKGTIMVPTVHDLHPDNMDDNIAVLTKLLEAGNDLLIVSKPHLPVIRRICVILSSYKDKILFRFTIGSASDEVLKFWEPGAPSYSERKESLIYALNHGFKTSVSCEPMLDDKIHLVVSDLEDYVTDALWLGKANLLAQRLKINGYGNDAETMAKAQELMDFQCDENIRALYERFKKHPKIKWKESIKEVVGIKVPTEVGLDI